MKRKLINQGHPNKYSDKLADIIDKVNKQKITYNDLFKLDISDDDLMWFVEYITILDNTPNNTEEYYRIKHIIYNRYINLDKNKSNKLILNQIQDSKNHIKNIDIVARICNSHYPLEIKTILYNKFILVNETDKSDEYFKVIEWLETILNLPTQISPSIATLSEPVQDLLKRLQDSLNANIYGHQKVKESILESYCASLTNPLYKKKFIALSSPPGCGKTAFGRAIAEAFNQPFSQISFGGIKDPHILTGHSMTYVGARPGLFTNILYKAQTLNSVVLLDEIDKIPDSVEGHSINSVLLHVLDKTQNNKFHDMYMPEIPINLSHIFFILALNNEELLDPILRDRLYIIKLDEYTLEDKQFIGSKYILPKIMKDLNFDNQDIIMNPDILEYIIEYNSDREKGVRNLEHKISTICERLNVLRNIGTSKKLKLSYAIPKLKFPIKITESIVDILLGN
jgi:ATP-dependent Lon protease